MTPKEQNKTKSQFERFINKITSNPFDSNKKRVAMLVIGVVSIIIFLCLKTMLAFILLLTASIVIGLIFTFFQKDKPYQNELKSEYGELIFEKDNFENKNNDEYDEKAFLTDSSSSSKNNNNSLDGHSK